MRFFLLAIVLVALALAILGHSRNSTAASPSVFHVPNVLTNPYAVIAHGGGTIDGHAITNSREAIEHSIQRGLKAIEVDLRQVSGGEFIGQYDEGKFRSAGVEDTSKLTPGELFAVKLHGKYHPVSGNDLKRIFLADRSLVLVTDKTRSYAALVAEFPFQDRVYVETFSVIQFLQARLRGVANPMLRIGSSFKWLLKPVIYMLGVSLVTVKQHDVEDEEGFYTSLKANGVCPLVSTVNIETFVERYKNSICAVYSDVLNAPGATRQTP